MPKILRLLLKILLWRPQLSHFLMAFACLLITVRVNNVIDSSETSLEKIESTQISVSCAQANAAEEKKDDKKEAPKEEKKEKTGDKTDASKKEDEAKTASTDPFEFDPLTMDENQIKVLKALAESRKKVGKEEENIEKQKKLMDVSEKKISQNLGELEKLKTTLEKKTKDLSKEEEENINRMVKVYEAMKPAAAAQIFNKLDLPVLIELVKNMNQKKFSLILTSMDPMKAQILTTEMLPKPAGYDNPQSLQPQPVTPPPPAAAPAPIPAPAPVSAPPAATASSPAAASNDVPNPK
jgi:flagellar motility protein MotE (MotC chaperone)